MLNDVILIISDIHSIPPDELSGETNLKNDLGFDSLDEVHLSVAIKDTLELDLVDAEFDKIKTINDVVEILERIARVKNARKV